MVPYFVDFVVVEHTVLVQDLGVEGEFVEGRDVLGYRDEEEVDLGLFG